MKKSLALALLMLLSASASTRADKDVPGKKAGRALMTFYLLIDESSSKYRGKRNVTLRDIHGKVIASTTYKFKRDLVMEGSGWLRDGRTVMFETKVHGESRFRVTSAKYGLTVTGCPLVPYRSIAVDSRFVKRGSTVYIPQLKGSKLPDGTEHDGIFIASDRGHFRGAHIDVFIGAGPRSARPFIRKGYGSRSHVMVYVADDNNRHDCKP